MKQFQLILTNLDFYVHLVDAESSLMLTKDEHNLDGIVQKLNRV